jgi:hypothetical protein
VVAYQPIGEATGEIRQVSTHDEFLAKWATAPAERRVFVAFTREDAQTAQRVAESMRESGFVVFTYLRDNETTPWAEPDLVGRLFKEAGHHLVIDTPTARKSAGVVFEALALARLKDVTQQAKPGRTGSGCRDVLSAK